jgi:4-hydroxy-3-polyprenylbenzoate decarboxylase
MKRLIVAMTGSSGAIYGIRLLEVLQRFETEVFLILSRWACRTIELETGYQIAEVQSLAQACYEPEDLTAPVSSGSFLVDAMVVVPASMKTVAGIAGGYSANLILRAADVTLKERRTLILLPRETPITAIHLENLLKLARVGAVILPPIPAFYIRPKTVEDIVDHTVGKILDQLGFQHDLFPRWGEGSHG